MRETLQGQDETDTSFLSSIGKKEPAVPVVGDALYVGTVMFRLAVRHTSSLCHHLFRHPDPLVEPVSKGLCRGDTQDNLNLNLSNQPLMSLFAYDTPESVILPYLICYLIGHGAVLAIKGHVDIELWSNATPSAVGMDNPMLLALLVERLNLLGQVVPFGGLPTLVCHHSRPPV